jgi:putative addiction module component (TIGR02574 family)
MSNEFEAVFNAAMQLTEDERVDLADRIYFSVSGEHQAEIDRAWAEEIDRRAKEIDEGRATLVAWEEVRDRLLKRTAP